MPPRRQNQHQLQRCPLHHRLWTGDQLRHLRLRHRQHQPPLRQPTLPLGAYITNVKDIDLLNDQFSIELLLWTIWQGDPDQNPSDQLRILNGL